MGEEMGSSDVTLEKCAKMICIVRRPRILLKNQEHEDFIYWNKHHGIYEASLELIRVMGSEGSGLKSRWFRISNKIFET